MKNSLSKTGKLITVSVDFVIDKNDIKGKILEITSGIKCSVTGVRLIPMKEEKALQVLGFNDLWSEVLLSSQAKKKDK